MRRIRMVAPVVGWLAVTFACSSPGTREFDNGGGGAGTAGSGAKSGAGSGSAGNDGTGGKDGSAGSPSNAGSTADAGTANAGGESSSAGAGSGGSSGGGGTPPMCTSHEQCPEHAECETTDNVCLCLPGYAGPDCHAIFEPLPSLTTHDGACFAEAISGDGTTIVGYCEDSALPERAFRWKAGAIESLDDEGLGSAAYGVSANGQVIVGSVTRTDDFDGNTPEPAAWTNSVLEVYLSDADRNNATTDSPSVLTDVSASGTIAIGVTGANGLAYWDVTSATLYGPEPVTLWFAPYGGEMNAISDAGTTMTGNYGSPSSHSAVYWTEAGGKDGLTTLAVTGNVPAGLSADGSTVVGRSNNQAVVWSSPEETPELLGAAGTAVAASADGGLIVGVGDLGGAGNEPFITDRTDLVGLTQALLDAGVTLTGWTLTHVTDISSDGTRLVGSGKNPDGVVQAFRVDLSDTGIVGL